MDSRLNFQQELEDLDESVHVYFQPPPSLYINYPAIIYSRSNIKNGFASNIVHTQSRYYDVIVVDKNPDSTIVTKVSQMDTALFKRHYTDKNLNYDVFRICYNKN